MCWHLMCRRVLGGSLLRSLFLTTMTWPNTRSEMSLSSRDGRSQSGAARARLSPWRSVGASLSPRLACNVQLEDRVARQLLCLLDGSRDRAASLAEMQTFMALHLPGVPPVTPEGLERKLTELAHLTLLVG
jgi:hypothetical protein